MAGSSNSDFLNCIASMEPIPKAHEDTGNPGVFNDNHHGSGDSTAAFTACMPQEFPLRCHDWQREQHEAGDSLFPPDSFPLWTTPDSQAIEEFSCALLPIGGFQSDVDFELAHFTTGCSLFKDKQQRGAQAKEAVATLRQQQEMPHQPGTFEPDVETQDLAVKEDFCIGGGCPMGQSGTQTGHLVEENNEGFDVLEEHNCIVQLMLGDRPSIDPILNEYLNGVVRVQQSLQTREPRHCGPECLQVTDPAECCWNMKLAEAQPSLKKAFQREITLGVSDYLRRHRKKVFPSPPTLYRSFEVAPVTGVWTDSNYGNPYMPETMAVKMAKDLGVTKKQIIHWMDNWRRRKWKPIPEGQTGRKGKKFRHLKADTTRIKNWFLIAERFPNKEEANVLSIGSSMTPLQILVFCNNFRKRNKHLFKNWKGGRSARSLRMKKL